MRQSATLLAVLLLISLSFNVATAVDRYRATRPEAVFATTDRQQAALRDAMTDLEMLLTNPAWTPDAQVALLRVNNALAQAWCMTELLEARGSKVPFRAVQTWELWQKSVTLFAETLAAEELNTDDLASLLAQVHLQLESLSPAEQPR